MLPMQCIAYCIYMDKLSGLSTVLILSPIALQAIRVDKINEGLCFFRMVTSYASLSSVWRTFTLIQHIKDNLALPVYSRCVELTCEDCWYQLIYIEVAVLYCVSQRKQFHQRETY